MLNAKDLLLHQERQNELQREARNEKLARESRQLWRAKETPWAPKDTPRQMLRTLSRLAALFL